MPQPLAALFGHQAGLANRRNDANKREILSEKRHELQHWPWRRNRPLRFHHPEARTRGRVTEAFYDLRSSLQGIAKRASVKNERSCPEKTNIPMVQSKGKHSSVDVVKAELRGRGGAGTPDIIGDFFSHNLLGFHLHSAAANSTQTLTTKVFRMSERNSNNESIVHG